MTFEEKVELARNCGIEVPKDILDEDIVGVYGFFARKNDREICFYIGKSNCIRERLLSSDNKGHIHLFLNKYYGDEDSVPNMIKQHIDDGYSISVRILARVDYHDEYYSRAEHRLALAEMNQIVLYQEMGQCLKQLPEGSAKDSGKKAFWEENYKI